MCFTGEIASHQRCSCDPCLNGRVFDCSEMKRERRSPSSDDVIVLSDEAPSPQVNGRNHFKELDADLLMVNT